MSNAAEWPNFFRLAKGLVAGQQDDLHEPYVKGKVKGNPHEAPLSRANLVSSRIAGSDMHRVVLDLDMDAALIPSSTPGHYHLFIDTALPWWKYKQLLIALADAGVIEPGYKGASIKRGASWVRTPWTHKKEAG